LMAGMAIGPYLLGALPFPGFPQGLFPVYGGFPVSPELYGLCAIASVVLLFTVGLETDIRLFLRYSVAGSLVGIGGVAVSFLFGDLLAVAFSELLFGGRLGFFSAPCLLLGIISTATSVGITARILTEERQTDSPEGVTILAGAVIDDVLGIILLAIGLGVISASKASGRIDWQHIVVLAGKAVGIWLAATVVGLLASRRISFLLKLFRERSSIATMALGLALVLAGFFEEAGLAMIIGAYVMGLSLSRTDISHVVRERLHPIYAFLVPVFFAVMGMLVDFRMLGSKQVLLFGVLYTLVANLAKILGCGLPVLFCNFNVRGALRIGFGMLPRGEVTLIIAGIGMASGLLPPQVLGIVVMMILITALVAPPMLILLFRNPASGLRKEPERERQSPQVFSFPSFETAELLVGKLLEVFESEGFFVHVLSRRERLYQLRKDDVVIGFQQMGTDIVFDSRASEKGLVNVAMVEVVAELEKTLNALRKPVDKKAIGKKLLDGAPGRRANALLKGVLSEEVLCPRLKGRTKEAVIDELLETLRRQGGVGDIKQAKASVWAREESMSTGMQYGIAVPHGRTDAVSRLVCAVGLKPEGIEFDSIDGQPARIVVLTLSPRSKPSPQVRLMSMISQSLNKEGREALLACRTAAEMLAALTGKMSARGTRVTKKAAAGARAGVPRASRLSEYLRPELVSIGLRGTTKTEVIDELLASLHERGLVSDVREARACVMAREQQMSTGMAHGVAIPHGRTHTVDRLVCAIGVKPEGVDFGAVDAELSKIVVLTLCPEDLPAPHVQFMAMISRALDEDTRAQVLSATTGEEVCRALWGG